MSLKDSDLNNKSSVCTRQPERLSTIKDKVSASERSIEKGQPMKFTIDRDAFSDVLFRVQGVCSQKSTLPILASCLVEAHEDGRISVHGTDLDVSISTGTSADVAEPGRVALTAKRLFDTVKSVPPGPLSIETEANHWAVLDADRVHARIAGSHPEEFPQLPTIDEELPVSIPSDSLLQMIERTYFSVSTDEARASFTGAYLSLTDSGSLQMVSTDGHRLSKLEVTPEGLDPNTVPAALTNGIIIPRKGLGELRRIVPKDSTVTFGVKGDDLLITNDATSLAVRLIPGRFPNFAQVIPQKLDHRVTVNRDLLTQALKRASYYTAKTGNTRLSLSKGTIEVYAFDPEAGELNEPIPCEYGGKGVSAGFNYKYLLDVLGVIEGDEVIIELIDTESPTVIRDPEREEALFIVMPMQL